MEQRKKNIIHVIGSNMIAYTSGNYITFHDLKHRQQMFVIILDHLNFSLFLICFFLPQFTGGQKPGIWCHCSLCIITSLFKSLFTNVRFIHLGNLLHSVNGELILAF